jgi:hypothetical protein
VYVKRHKVRREGKDYTYLRLVEAFRTEDGKVRHRLLHTLGREDVLKASGQLDQLAASFARLDPPPVGTRRQVGALLLVRHYLQRLDLVKVIDRVAPMRGRAQLTHGEVISALVANRLSAPSPLYDVAGWASSAALAELFDIPAMLLNDDRLGRALQALAPLAEPVRGELALAAARTGGADLSRLHLDLTAVRFAGAYEGSAMVQKGWAADRSIGRQVRTLQASTVDGIPVYYRPHKGGESEVVCFAEAMERLHTLAPPGLVVVADSGLGYLRHLCAADRAGLRFVVPLRADTGWADRFLDDVGDLDQLVDLPHTSQREQNLPADKRTRRKGLLRPYPVTDPDRKTHHDLRVAYIWSSEEATSVADARARALEAAEAALTRVRNGIGGRFYKTQKDIDTKVAQIIGKNITGLLHVATGTDPDSGKPTLTWQRDQAAITAAGQLDGLYALATNVPDPSRSKPVTALDILKIYKDQWVVEQRHRDLKQTLRVRPVFLHNDDRITALVAVIGIALLIFGLIEADLRRSLGPNTPLPGLLGEGRAAKPTGRSILTAFADLHLTYTHTGPVLDRLTHAQRTILAHLDIPLPWPETINQAER